MPQPKSGLITRSPLAVPSMFHTDWRTLSSYSAISIAPEASSAMGKPQPLPRNVFGILCLHDLLCSPNPDLLFQPINTVPTAMTCPTGKSEGSLQVFAVSPLRAAIFPLILTVGLPTIMVALFEGGLANAVPGGVAMCGGVLSAVLFTVAAGTPMIFTSLLRPPEITPANGCGSGVCPGGDGMMTMCMSTATTWSPFFAAGCPISSVPVTAIVSQCRLVQLMLTVAPFTVMVPLAFTSIVLPASSFVAAEDLISTFCASSLMVPLEAEIVMSWSLVMVIVFFAVSITMLFFWLLSNISIVSLPSSSFSLITCPLRDWITRTLFLPSPLVAGGASLPFHNAPSTYGKRTSPCSKATRTSSSTSGRK